MRLTPADHLCHPWRVHALAPDFDLLDVWRFPLTANPARGETLATVCHCFLQQLEQAEEVRGLTGFLFKLREAMGRVFGWDDAAKTYPIPGCTETSLRDRLATPEAVTMPTVGVNEGAAFSPVYTEPTEVLYETSNGTVHALLHLGWVPVEDGAFAVEMAVYAKARGWLGRLYMALIAPFRHWIVYPAMMRWMKRRWPICREQLVPAAG